MAANIYAEIAPKPQRREWKVLLVLALFLLVMETLVRCFAGKLSLDVRNTIETPKIAGRFASTPDDEQTVLVVGNSLARCGLDTSQLGRNTGWTHDQDERIISTEFFAPDASSVVQWNWGIRRYFANARSHPDIILLFTGRNHLLDLPTSPETLGAYYVGTSDLGEALKSMQSSEQAIDLMVGASSHLFANRYRIRPRICYPYLPGFKIAWPALTEVRDTNTGASDQSSPSPGTKSLERLIKTVHEMGSELHVISVPMPEPYALPQPVLRLLEEANIPYHNLSTVPGIEISNFPDGYHLDKSGASIFTKALLATFKDDQE